MPNVLNTIPGVNRTPNTPQTQNTTPVTAAVTQNGQPVTPNTFTNGAPAPQPIPGVGANVPAAPPAPAQPVAWKGVNSSGKIYDAQEYLTEKLKISGGGTLRIFHHTDTQWGVPGVKRKMTISQNKGQTGQVYGPGFYTSTKPETGFGKYEFQIELPFKAFAGKKIYETTSGGDEMPPGVDILAVPQTWGDKTWFVFKAPSEAWLNRSALEADFDAAGEAVGWS